MGRYIYSHVSIYYPLEVVGRASGTRLQLGYYLLEVEGRASETQLQVGPK